MKNFKILIVEDVNLFREAFKTTLEASFPRIAVDQATDESEALQKVDTFLPDLIFMDIRLPEGNGLELTKKIKATYPNINIVILTNHDIREYREAASQCGADQFLVKDSFSRMELEELVKAYQKF